MNQQLPTSAELASRLGQVAGDYTDRLQRGESPDVEEYTREHPELADLLRAVLPAVHALGGGGADTVRPGPHGGGRVPADVAPPVMVGGYSILGELGRGGMGIVYKAYDPRLGRVVALKVILPDAGGDESDRLKAEAQAVARLNHPHIVQIYEVGEDNDRPFLALEYLPGGTLEAALRGVPVPPREAADLLRPLARAVHAAHQAGIIHRDLKPGNVLFGNAECGMRNAESEPEAGGSGLHSALRIPHSAFTPKVSDFGLARAVDATHRLTQTGAIVGTPSYMAPEQAEGRGTVGPAADVYSLGAILYEMLTGRPPFRGVSLLDTLLQVRSGDPVRPSRLQPACPRDLETVCLKCLQRDPGKRYPSALELEQELGRYLSGEPIAARPTGTAEWAWRWCLRNPAAVALVGVVVVGVVVLAVGLAVMAGLNRELTTRNAALDQTSNALQARNVDLNRALDRSEKDRAVATGVNDFFHNDLLGQTAIGNQDVTFPGGRDPDITVVAVLDRAAERIEGKFRDQPETAAAIRLTIGDAYRLLGRYAEADTHIVASVELRRRVLGEDHADTLASLHVLALLRMDQHRLAEAERHLREVLRRREALGDNGPQIFRTRSDLAALDLARGNYVAAVRALRDLLDRHVPPVTPASLVLTTRLLLAHALLLSGRYREAEEVYRAVQQHWPLTDDHPRTMTLQTGLGELYRVQGRYAEAESLLRAVADRSRVKLKPDHPATLTCLNNLAVTYLMRKKFGLAEQLLRDVLEQARQRGESRPTTLGNLGQVYLDQGKLTQARSLLEEARRQSQKANGDDHPATLPIEVNLGRCYCGLEEYGPAEALYGGLVPRCETALGREHPTTLHALNGLAHCYVAQKKFDAAEALYRDLVQRGEQTLGADHPTRLVIENHRADLASVRGRFPEAEKVYLDVLKRSAALLGDDHPQTVGFKYHLAEVHFTRRVFRQSARWLEEAARDVRSEDPQRLTIIAQLGGVYARLQRYEEAKQHLREAIKGHQATPDAGDSAALGIWQNLGWVHLLQREYAEAEVCFIHLFREGKKAGGLKHPTTWEAVTALQEVYEGWGMPAVAEPFLRELLSAYPEGAEASSSSRARARVHLGVNLLRQKKHVEEAAQLLSKGLELDPGGWLTADTKSWLGEALLAQGKAAEAKPWLEQGYDGLKQQQAQVPARLRPVRLREAVERLIRVSDALDDAGSAAKWRVELQKLSLPTANK